MVVVVIFVVVVVVTEETTTAVFLIEKEIDQGVDFLSKHSHFILTMMMIDDDID